MQSAMQPKTPNATPLQTPPKHERNVFVDILRGLSMASVVSLHAMANYLTDPNVLKLWDYQQFAVQIVVFCSAYLYFSRPPTLTAGTFIPYVIKRFWRLYLPFLVFAIIYFSIVALLRPQNANLSNILWSLSLLKGIDINWLVLLFVQFIFVFPLIQFLRVKFKFGFYFYAFITIYTAVFLFLIPFPYNWKWIMWLPWSFMALYAIFYKKYETHPEKRHVSYMLFTAVFVMIICFEAILRQILTIYPNKYPPNMLILAYGIIWIGIFDVLYEQKFFEKARLIKPLSFFSKHSYSLFFIHYIVIYIMNTAFFIQKKVSWPIYWVLLFTITIGIQLIMLRGKAMFIKPAPSSP